MPQNNIENETERTHKQLNASFALAGYLLGAQDQHAAILGAMRIGNDLLGAEGCAFVPFSEFQDSLPVLKYGEAGFLDDKTWQARLSAPATRHACRVCEREADSSECTLLQELTNAHNVFCVGLRCCGREIGVISYFLLDPPQVDSTQRQFLGEMVHLTELSLDAMRVREQRLESTRRASVYTDLKNNMLALDAMNEELLGQIEYKAVLDERSRLAREIHDGLAQTLAFLKLEAARMQGYVSKGEVDSISSTLQACHQTLSDAYLDARQAIDNLRQVPDESLIDWLQATAADFKALTGMTVDVSNVCLDYAFSPNVKAQVIRIVQEALNNVRKHAQACTVVISTFERDADFILEVRDNGRGFSPEGAQSTPQYGLRSMRERAESIEADFQVVSTPGAGTTVRLQIPVPDNSKQ